jgi:hypothetical protein
MLGLRIEPPECGDEGLARRLVDGVANLWPLDRHNRDSAAWGIANQGRRSHLAVPFSLWVITQVCV